MVVKVSALCVLEICGMLQVVVHGRQYKVVVWCSQNRCEAHILGSIAAANVFNEKNSPNIIFWSSEVVPAPCLTSFGLDHS